MEEVFLEGMTTEMEAEEMDQDLLVGVVFQKTYEELGPCGSAAHFLLGMEKEGEQLGREEVEGGALMAVETGGALMVVEMDLFLTLMTVINVNLLLQ